VDLSEVVPRIVKNESQEVLSYQEEESLTLQKGSKLLGIC